MMGKIEDNTKFTTDKIIEVMGFTNLTITEDTRERFSTYAEKCNSNIGYYKGVLYALEYSMEEDITAPIEIAALWMPKELRGKGLAHKLLVYLNKKHRVLITFTPKPVTAFKWFTEGYRYGIVVQPAPDGQLKGKFCYPRQDGMLDEHISNIYKMHELVPHGIYTEALTVLSNMEAFGVELPTKIKETNK